MCTLCEETEKRFERAQKKVKQVERESQLAIALAARAETQAAGKVQWHDDLPSVSKLAKTAANKAQQALQAAGTQSGADRKPARAQKGVKEDEQSKAQQKGDGKAGAKAKKKLRIQQGR